MSDEPKLKVGDRVRFRNRPQSSTEPMVIKKIDGKDHYLDWDHRPWLAGNLMLDSEWKDMHDERPLYQKLGLPLVQRGFPIPPAKPKRKARVTVRKPSKWVGFLKDLKYGDTFVLTYPEVASMKSHAAKLGIELRWTDHPEKSPDGYFQQRFWRV